MYIKGALTLSNYFSKVNWKDNVFRYPRAITKTPYSHQKEAEKIHENLFVTLPTGVGKTETALYWAKNNFQKRGFYVLPTVTATSVMLSKLKQIYGNTNSITYNGQIDLLVNLSKRLLNNSKLENDADERYQNFLLLKYLLSLVNVTSVDQLILTLMN